MMNHDATPTGHGLPLARRRSLVLALAGSAGDAQRIHPGMLVETLVLSGEDGVLEC